MELLDQHFTALAKGEEILVPKFAFARQMRDSAVTPLRLGKDEVAIFEGIHALNDDIAGRHPEAACMYISARSNVCDGDILRFKGTWMRLTRRAVRDYQFRGTGVEATMVMWANVRRGEKLYISPFKGRADIIIDSSLPYEVSVMKNYALPLLQAVPEENARRTWQNAQVYGGDSDSSPPLSPKRNILLPSMLKKETHQRRGHH
jgi:uridine kinase